MKRLKRYKKIFGITMLSIVLVSCGATIDTPANNANKVHSAVIPDFNKFNPSAETLSTLRVEKFEKTPLQLNREYQLELDLNAGNIILEYSDSEYVEIYYSPENVHKLMTVTTIGRDKLFIGDELTAKRAEGYLIVRVPRNVKLTKYILRVGVLDVRIKK